MKRIICILSLLVWSLAAFSQENRIPQRLELVEIEINDGQVNLEVFNMPNENENHYYLSVGTLGIGDEVVQIKFDPIFELFIPLGETLSEAMQALQEMQGLFKADPGASLETEGCLAPAFPNNELEPVKVTYRRLIFTRVLEFSVEREGYIRATHIPRSDFNSMITSLNIYRKIHPNEE